MQDPWLWKRATLIHTPRYQAWIYILQSLAKQWPNPWLAMVWQKKKKEKKRAIHHPGWHAGPVRLSLVSIIRTSRPIASESSPDIKALPFITDVTFGGSKYSFLHWKRKRKKFSFHRSIGCVRRKWNFDYGDEQCYEWRELPLACLVQGMMSRKGISACLWCNRFISKKSERSCSEMRKKVKVKQPSYRTALAKWPPALHPTIADAASWTLLSEFGKSWNNGGTRKDKNEGIGSSPKKKENQPIAFQRSWPLLNSPLARFPTDIVKQNIWWSNPSGMWD